MVVEMNDPFKDSNKISQSCIFDMEENGEMETISKNDKNNNNNEAWFKRKWVIVPSVMISIVLSFLFLLFLLKHNNSHYLNDGVDKYIGLYKKADIQVNDGDSDNWRLDTGKNYTSDLKSWRRDYGKSIDRHYYFNITHIEKMNANGEMRNLTVINNQFPGPLIEANSGDTIYLHVSNQMDDEPVSFHLHGLFYINNTFDDGASSINNCPIPPGGNYTYKIPISDEEFGTYWYHSHWSTQYADGVYGPLILHSPTEDKKLDYYDADKIIIVNDYYYKDTGDLLSEYLIPDNENSEPTPDAGLISGVYSQNSNYLTSGDQDNKLTSSMYFNPKKYYRVRVANVGYFLPFKFSIDQHKLKLIEADGTLIEPLDTDYVDIAVGERYSFFLNRTNEDEDVSYWIHARFNQFCLATDNSNFTTDVLAILSYENEDDEYDKIPNTSQTWEYDGGSPKCLGFTPQNKLRTLDKTVPINNNGTNRPDSYVELDISFTEGAYQMTYGYFNDYTWSGFKNTSTMHELLFNEIFRNKSHIENEETYNEHQYVLNFDKRGMIVDLLINNFDDGSHPFHLHGYKFWVLANEKSGSFYPDFYESRSDKLDLTNPILKDTINVPPFGFAVLRFVVDNPGVFPFHCHIGWHIEAGLLLQINALQSEWMEQDYSSGWANMCGYDFSDDHLTKLQIGLPG